MVNNWWQNIYIWPQTAGEYIVFETLGPHIIKLGRFDSMKNAEDFANKKRAERAANEPILPDWESPKVNSLTCSEDDIFPTLGPHFSELEEA